MKVIFTLNRHMHCLRSGIRLSTLMFFFFILVTSPVSALTKQYAVTDMGTLISDLAAGNADIYELTESGGQYFTNSTVTTNILIGGKSAIIRAKSGLAAKPMMKFTTTGTAYVALFSTATPNLSVTFDGIEFDGRNTGTVQPLLMYVQDAATNCQLVINNCFLHHFTAANGAFYLRGQGASLDMAASTVDNCSGLIINFYTPTATAGTANYGALTLKNNTFSNTTGASSVVSYRSTIFGLATGTSATIDHCIFYNSTSSSNILVFRQMTGSVVVSNCIFSQVAGGFSFASPMPTVDNCYLAGFVDVPIGTNSFPATPAPLFKNAATLDFSLSNLLSFTCSDGQIAGNTTYYPRLDTPGVGVADQITGASFTAHWTAVANALSYVVKTYQGSNLVSSTPANGTSVAVTSLLPGVTYTYTVVALGDGVTLANSMPSIPSATVRIFGQLYQFQQGFLSTTGWVRTISSTSANNGLYPGTTGAKFDAASSAPAAGRKAKSIITPSVMGGDSVSFYLSKGSSGLIAGNIVYVAKIVGADTIQVGSVDASSLNASSSVWKRCAFPVQESGSVKLIFYALNSTTSYFYIDDIALTKSKLTACDVTVGASLVGANSFTANWSPVNAATGYFVSVYQGGVLLGTAHYADGQATTSLTIEGLALGTAYTYKVVATDNTSNYNDANLSPAAAFTTASTAALVDCASSSTIITVSGKIITTSELGIIQVFNLQGGLVAQMQNSDRMQTQLASGSYIVRFTNLLGMQSIRKVIIL